MSEDARHDELRQLADEHAALRRVATLVAAGAVESDLVACVTAEVAKLLDADAANMLRWDGETVRVIGDWYADGRTSLAGRVYTFGGDTITARVVESGAPARVESAGDFRTEFARARWAELGFEASLAAPVVVEGRVWGVVTASRTTPDNPFPPGAEHRLGDFAALVAQAIANAESRREVTELAAEQAALRRVATLVAGGRRQEEVLEAAAGEAGHLLGASAVAYLRWEGVHDEVVVVGGWDDGTETLAAESLYHPAPDSATIGVLETGLSTRTNEISQELGARCAISSPVIVNGRLIGAFTALRSEGEPFAAGAESRLRGFSDLVAQSIVNVRAQEEMRASAARIVRASDDARKRLERNLHDGAQQRLVAVSISMRLALARLPAGADASRALLISASDELAHAIDELRELARGIHPALLTDRGLGPALEALASRTPLQVAVANELEDERLPLPVEAAAYFIVAESLTNIAKHAEASKVEVRVSRQNGVARVEVTDDGVGGADASRGSGLRGLADRVEALAGRLHIVSPPDAGTRVWAEIPL